MGHSSFEAARDAAYNMNWSVFPEKTPDSELYNANTLITLRARSRQLTKDSSIVAGIQQRFANNVGSPNAVKASTSDKYVSDLRLSRMQNFISERIKDMTFSNEGLSSVVEQLINQAFCDGDILISLPLDKSRELGKQTVVELIEAQRIRTPNELTNNINVRNGVEYFEDGRIKGYWVKKYDKVDRYGDSKGLFTFYPRKRNGRLVTDLFKAPLNARPKMSRQYPVITPAMKLIKQLNDYIEAVIVGARVAACFSAFVKTQNPAGAWGSMTSNPDGSPNTDSEGNRVSKLYPGMVHYLRRGEEIEFASPNRPNDNVDSFIIRLCKLIAAYTGIPYEILFLDLSETNYSSWRGGANEMKKVIARWRNRINAVLDWIIDTFIYEAEIYDLVASVSEMEKSYTWPSYNILDPEKEARANDLELANETTSPQRLCEERAISYREVQDEIKQHLLDKVSRVAEVLKYIKEKEAELGVKIPIELIFSESKSSRNNDGVSDGDKKGVEDDAKRKNDRKKQGNW